MHKVIINSFKLRGLVLQLDALEVLQELCQQQANATEFIDKILNSIDSQKLNQGMIDKQTIERCVEQQSKSSDDKEQEDFIRVISAFDMPKYIYNQTKKTFDPAPNTASLHGTASDKTNMLRERFVTIHQRLLSNPLFQPPVLASNIDQHQYYKLTPIESLIGATGTKYVLGILTQLEEGRYFLEDLKSHIELDLSQAEKMTGLFTENSVVLVEGEVSRDEQKFHVKALAYPPSQPRSKALALHPQLNCAARSVPGSPDTWIMALSDVWLDRPAVLSALKTLLTGVTGMGPGVLVLMGNFISDPKLAVSAQSQLMSQLGKVLQVLATKEVKVVIVPGPHDFVASSPGVLPRAPLMQEFQELIANQSGLRLQRDHVTEPNLYFATSPCRITCGSREVVVFRDDVVNKLRRHCVMKPSNADTASLVQHFTKTVLECGHLCPLPLTVQPIYWPHDHALRLYPTPDCLLLGDHFTQFTTEHEDCHVINPGSFPVEFNFAMLTPLKDEYNLLRVQTDL